MTRSLRHVRFLLLVPVALLVACGDDPVTPRVDVIQDADFAPSLGIDLEDFTKKSSGLYYKDVVVGEGDPARIGDLADVSYTLWLTDGTEVETGRLEMVVDAGLYLTGFEEGVRDMRPGGVRIILVPPGLAYGSAGSDGIPPGAILVFELTLHGLS